MRKFLILLPIILALFVGTVYAEAYFAQSGAEVPGWVFPSALGFALSMVYLVMSIRSNKEADED